MTQSSRISLKRAERALKCAPFSLKLFTDMSTQGIALRAIADSSPTNPYVTRSVNLITAENSLLWLVQVGVLRREVDGQGITDSFRLTPLGYEILEKWQPQGHYPKPTVLDRLQNLLAQLQPARFF